jgi:hypothetical protein
MNREDDSPMSEFPAEFRGSSSIGYSSGTSHGARQSSPDNRQTSRKQPSARSKGGPADVDHDSTRQGRCRVRRHRSIRGLRVYRAPRAVDRDHISPMGRSSRMAAPRRLLDRAEPPTAIFCYNDRHGDWRHARHSRVSVLLHRSTPDHHPPAQPLNGIPGGRSPIEIARRRKAREPCDYRRASHPGIHRPAGRRRPKRSPGVNSQLFIRP